MEKVESEPKVFVLTLNWNGKRFIGECLESLERLDYSNYEIVVIDNGSTDGSIQYIQKFFPKVKLLANGENLGYAKGLNRGLEYAYERGAKYFLILNNDTKIDKNGLKALVNVATEHPECGYITGKIYYYDKPDTLQTVGFRLRKDFVTVHIGVNEKDVGQYDSVEKREFCDDVMMLVSQRVYCEVGGYSPVFFLNGEEFDWQLRGKRQGFEILYTPHAKTWHKVSLSMGGAGNPKGPYFTTRNKIVAMARNVNIKKFLIFLIFFAFTTLRSALGATKHREFKLVLAYAMGFSSGLLWLVNRSEGKDVPFFRT